MYVKPLIKYGWTTGLVRIICKTQSTQEIQESLTDNEDTSRTKKTQLKPREQIFPFIPIQTDRMIRINKFSKEEVRIK